MLSLVRNFFFLIPSLRSLLYNLSRWIYIKWRKMNSCAIITQRSSYCICSRMNLWEMNDLRATRWKEHKKKREIKFKASSNEIARIFYSKRHSILIAFVFNFCWTSSAYAISTDNISSIKYIEQQSPHGVKVNKYWWRNRDVPTQREESSRKKDYLFCWVNLLWTVKTVYRFKLYYSFE